MTLTVRPARLIRNSALVLTILMTTVFDCFGQAARPERGVMPTGSYAISNIENINLTNGNLNLSIPLASLPPMAGGKLGFTIRAEYNSKGWDTVRQELQSDPLNPETKYVVTHLQQAGVSGWRIGGTYQISFEDITWDYDWLPPPPNDPEYNLLTQNRWSKVMLITPDGATHELRPVDYSPYPDGFLNHNYLRGYYKDDPNTAGTALRYYSYDGSHLWAKIDPSPYLYAGAAPSWVIYLPDGTRVEQANGIQRIIDTNGNKVKIWTDGSGTVWTTHYQDEQTGREIKYVYDSAGNGGLGLGQVQYPTVTGISKTITVNFGTTHVFGKVHAANDPECANPSVLIDTEIPVVRSIVLPQTEPGQAGRQLSFSYNSDTTDTVNVQWRPNCAVSYQTITSASHGWGSLSQIVMPSGAIVDYVYSFDGQTFASFDPDDASRENLTTKTVTHDGISESWTYSLGPAGSGVTSPDGSFVNEFRYPSDPAFSHNYAGFGGKEGMVYRTNNSNRTLIERHWSLMIFSGGNNIAPGASVLVGFNPVVDAEYISLLDDTPPHNPVKMSAKTFQYDYNGNVTQVTEYDWFDPSLVSRDAQGVPTGVPGSATILRVTNNSYYNQATTASSSNVYAKRSLATGTPLILNALQQSTIGPSIVQLSYDGQAYGVAPTVGNLTTKKVWVDLDSKWITTSNTYDLYGNLLTATDGRGKVTQLFYDDATHALPTRVVVDPQNSTGTQTTTTAYDYHTGLVTSQTDANGQIATIDYTNQSLGTIDPFGRPGVTLAPQININGTNHRRRVTTKYLDSTRQVLVETDLNAENDKLLKTLTTTDQLGRPVRTEQTENGTTYTISAVTKYLNMGRVTLSSSPRRSAESNTDSWTRVTKDNAGRVIEVATFGGAAEPAWSDTTGVFTGAVTTTYDANFTTVTDQTGKVRRSMIDALGRLRRVDEPDNSGSLGSTTNPAQPTSYNYDVFGNLTTVTQGAQTRTFTYDSLSRLRTAANPESGTVSYQYDDNSNLLVKTDARTDPLDANKKVSTHFTYDSLNRVTRRWYNGSSSVAATTHNDPSLPSNVGATNEAKFYYDTQPLPAGAPSYTRGSAVGRLVAQTYGTGTNGDYYAYDVLGRATLKIQQTGTMNYQMSAAYSLSGALNTLTYPSGHVVNHLYDPASRLTTLSGNLGDGLTRTYLSGIIYSPVGGLVQEEFGTATPVFNKRFYNNRGQLAEIRVGTTPNDTGWQRGAIINHYSAQCWGACTPTSSMTDNNGNLKQQDHFIPDSGGGVQAVYVQTFDYDSLNRLQRVREGSSQQEYVYDRWGNRTIHQTNTYGTGIPKPNFGVNTTNNRLTAPAGFSMTYDAAGNLTNDTYTGAGNRTYDVENKITSAWGGNNQAQLYAYDVSGQRIKRTVNGVETWQVYGFGGELLAEYAASGAATSPQKEYGYRNGQLLITAAPATSSGGPPTSGLAGHWKFDENSGTTAADFSGNNNTGTLTSGASWATGQSGAATSLDGVNDYVQVGAQSSLAMTTAASFSAWIYPTGLGSLATYGGIILDKEGEYEIARFADGTIHWAFANTSPGYNWINTGYVAPLNQWTHLTITYDSGVVKTYINGSLTHTFSGTGAIGDANTTWNDFRIGGRQAVSQHFQGRIDEVRVYNRALSASEVATLPGGNNVPQIYWLVTDQLGTPRMVLDQTGNLNTMKRHDYLPFGEELFAPTGGRSTAQGYSVGGGIRQQFTLKERDVETGLDYFLARYYSSTQGRFTSPDEFTGGPIELYYFVSDASANPTFYADFKKPQSLNKYQYSYNNPLRYVDSDGHAPDQNPKCKCPTDQEIIETVTSVLDTVADATGITALADWLRVNVPAAVKQIANSQPCLDAGTCEQQLILQKQVTPKEVVIDGSKHPDAASHAADAQKAGQPNEVTVDRAGAADRRREAQKGQGRVPGKDNDEYPPAVFKEGGRGASVRPISPKDNRGAGASIGQQIKDVPNGDKVKITVINWLISVIY